MPLDGIYWRKLSTTGLFANRKKDVWDSSVISDPTLFYDKDKGQLMIWYGGGDKPNPAQNINGQIGLIRADISQNRSMNYFDANADWKNSGANSKDVLQGSYDIEGDTGQSYYRQ